MSADSLEKKKNVAFLFAADWCKPCRDFRAQARKYYELAKRRRQARDPVGVAVGVMARGALFNSVGSAPSSKKATRRLPPTLCFMDTNEVGSVITCDRHGQLDDALPVADPERRRIAGGPGRAAYRGGAAAKNRPREGFSRRWPLMDTNEVGNVITCDEGEGREHGRQYEPSRVPYRCLVQFIRDIPHRAIVTAKCSPPSTKDIR